MKFTKVKLAGLLWAAGTVLVIVALLLLDINRQQQALQLESRVLYEFAYENVLINEVILHNFVELVATDHTDIATITRYSRALREHYPHLRRLQIYQRVGPDQQALHEQKMLGAGNSGYRVHPSDLAAAAAPTPTPSPTPAGFKGNAYSQAYPIIFVEPRDGVGRRMLGEDGYSIGFNQRALIQSSHYLSVFATDHYPLDDGTMGYRLMHALDPRYTGTTEASLIVALVLRAEELLLPSAHLPKGLSVTLADAKGAALVNRENPEAFGGWLLPQLEARRSLTRFGQTLQLQVRKQLLWAETSWPFGLIVLLFSVVAHRSAALGLLRRAEARRATLMLTRRLEGERDQLEQRVLERTQELVGRNSELRQQVKENRQLTQKILEVQESERRNIARELHDEMGQSLTAIRTDARLLQQSHCDPASREHTAAVAIDTTAQRIYGVTYALMRALRPSALDDLGLVDAIEQCVESLNLRGQGIVVHVQFSGALNELPEQVCIQCYRIIQEALNNCVKYAEAGNLWLIVRLESEGAETSEGPDRLLIRVEDDGVGFDPKNQDSGFGLIGMRERALALEGDFEVSSAPGQGTKIQVELPVKALNFEILDADPCC
ncbi:MAG: ATP-binding protein [Motiliproteus sp.]